MDLNSLTQQAAQEAAKKHGSMSAAAKALGIPKTTFSDRCQGSTKPNLRKAAPDHAERTAAKGRPLTDFRAEYDKAYIVPRKIKDGLKALGNGWDYESGFAKLCGLSLSDIGNFRDAFAPYVVALRDRRAWAGTITTAKAMRDML